MAPPFRFSESTRALIRLALHEDLSLGDVTTDAIFGPDDRTTARFIAKESLVAAGLPVVEEVMREVDADATFAWQVGDGASVERGTFGVLRGRVGSLLRAERTMLNFMRHLSGVATVTRRYVDALGSDGPALVDTRKTTPGFRELEKYAVRLGGGRNHRYNLGSGGMVKNNHISAAGSIAEAVAKVRDHAPFLTRIEVEVANLDELQQALDAGADAVLLDNMTTAQMREACALVAGRALVEASGNITLARLPELRGIGLDFVSCGAITHSAPNVDISLTFDRP
jgi:nicotinate-nucleotide pyrophosphorylase (carboxylating)